MTDQERSNLIASRNVLSESYDLRKCRDVQQFRSIGEQIDILDARLNAEDAYFVADLDTDLENGTTVETAMAFGSPEFWDDCDRQAGYCIDKAVRVNCDREWISDNIWR